MGKRVADMTPEEIESARALARERGRVRWANVTPEVREQNRQRSRDYRATLSPDRAEQVRARKRVANMTPEEVERSRKRQRMGDMAPDRAEQIRARKRVANMTPEQIRRRREQQRARLDALPEERERRREQQRVANMTPEEARERQKQRRDRRFRLQPGQWDALFEAQGCCCAICHVEDPGKEWHTDHCHTTGRVRGILCPGCNWALGGVRDTPTIALAAAEYLERHRVCDHVLCSAGPSGTCLLAC